MCSVSVADEADGEFRTRRRVEGQPSGRGTARDRTRNLIQILQRQYVHGKHVIEYDVNDDDDVLCADGVLLQ